MYRAIRKTFSGIYHLCNDMVFVPVFSRLFRVFPINGVSIVICAYKGGGFSCNPRAVVEKLLTNEKRGRMRIIWAVNDLNRQSNKVPMNIEVVKYKSLRYLWHLCTAKIWIDNSRKDFVPRKRKGQVYFQLWHGSIMLKKVEKDAITLPKRYIKYAKLDSKNADYFVSGSKYTNEKIRDAFWYDGKILEVGTPRADILVDGLDHTDIIDRVRKEFGLKDEKILLYAPTFRADGSLSAYNIDYERLVSALKNRFGGEWKILVRLHPNIAKKSDKLGLKQKYIVDASTYPEIEDLYLVSDACITDYSSVMFEFSYTKKPVFLYASDIGSYVEDRGFYFDIRKLPYPLAQDNDELEKNIEDYSDREYQNRLGLFFSKIGLNETGKASEVVANIILDIIKNGV